MDQSRCKDSQTQSENLGLWGTEHNRKADSSVSHTLKRENLPLGCHELPTARALQGQVWYGFNPSNTHLQPYTEAPGSLSSSAEPWPQSSAWLNPPGCALLARRAGETLGTNLTAGTVQRLPSSSPPTPRVENIHPRTYPGFRRGRTHSTLGPAPRTRSQLAAAASLASCELCAAEGVHGAPSPCARRPWEKIPSFEDCGAVCGPAPPGLQQGDAQFRGKVLREIASWSASRAGAGSPNGDTGGGGALHGRSSELSAGRARCAHHDSVARRRRLHGGAGGPG